MELTPKVREQLETLRADAENAAGLCESFINDIAAALEDAEGEEDSLDIDQADMDQATWNDLKDVLDDAAGKLADILSQ